ncbi:hypothetical protein HYPDE_26428 [Hyphomicrobium denitrificans 1NES1]|uniref:Calcium-binding protein n=1 Tax=Hyphomicrobium denitrificans 1NES1 TaxID=670307 RepID=N0B8V7_9HYPH|nr:calcium-binding protein [Hyphomicrobium denitrificans]AGK56966.1 hypothetical protein HYPDE_26428 [Hyphomicrobium denitrificans 1NES1]
MRSNKSAQPPTRHNGTGNSLANVITANAGNNVLDGGAGTDTASYATAMSGVMVSLGLTGAQATGGSGTDTLLNFENLTGSAYNDTLTGSAGVSNVLTGGAGNDTYYVQDTGDIVTEAANGGTDSVFSSVTYTLAANVENLTLTGTANINGTGNALNNILTGNSGTNALAGGAGNDTYIIQNTTDVVSEASSAGTDTVLSSVTYTLGSNVENLTLTGAAAINATGNALANTLNGGSGIDTMIGHGGNDTYYVDNAADVVTEGYQGGSDTVYASVSYTLAAGQEIEFLRGNAGSTGLTLTGNEFNNTIIGNTGADTLNGGLGNDTLTGGSGADSFVFNTALNASTNVDTITDFTRGSDKIKLDNAIFTALGTTQNIALPASAFYIGTAAHDSDDHIIYNSTTGDLMYDPDGTGSAPAVLFAHLSPGLTTLAASDFTIV